MNSFLLLFRLRQILAALVLVAVGFVRGLLALLRWVGCAAVVVAFGAPLVAGACLAVLGLGLALIAWASGRFLFAAASRL